MSLFFLHPPAFRRNSLSPFSGFEINVQSWQWKLKPSHLPNYKCSVLEGNDVNSGTGRFVMRCNEIRYLYPRKLENLNGCPTSDENSRTLSGAVNATCVETVGLGSRVPVELRTVGFFIPEWGQGPAVGCCNRGDEPCNEPSSFIKWREFDYHSNCSFPNRNPASCKVIVRIKRST
jgi:hypothetical protein